MNILNLPEFEVIDTIQRDLNSFGKRLVIEIHTNRYKCKYCKSTFSQHYKSIDDRDKITKRLREQIERESLKKPFANIAEEYSISATTVKRIFESYVKEAEKDLDYSTPIILGIDEAHLNKCMRAVYTDIIGRKVLDIQPSRKKSVLHRFANKKTKEKDILCRA